MKTVLTIAGSDASGGAGIQADIKTLTVHKVYATSCITALTAQNTKGITGIMPVPPDFFEKQMDSVFSDIKPDAVKIGMIASKEQVEIIAKYLQKYSIKQVVADPVMISTSGTILVEEEVREVLYEKLFPNISLLTPNLPETEFYQEGRSQTGRREKKRQKLLQNDGTVQFLAREGTVSKMPMISCMRKPSSAQRKSGIQPAGLIIQIPMELGAHFQVR